MKTSFVIILVTCGTLLIMMPFLLSLATILAMGTPPAIDQFSRYGLLPVKMKWSAFAIGVIMVLIGTVGTIRKFPRQE